MQWSDRWLTCFWILYSYYVKIYVIRFIRSVTAPGQLTGALAFLNWWETIKFPHTSVVIRLCNEICNCWMDTPTCQAEQNNVTELYAHFSHTISILLIPLTSWKYYLLAYEVLGTVFWLWMFQNDLGWKMAFMRQRFIPIWSIQNNLGIETVQVNKSSDIWQRGGHFEK